eukprot:60524-Chlamydomonas_euryale.AAC.1
MRRCGGAACALTMDRISSGVRSASPLRDCGSRRQGTMGTGPAVKQQRYQNRLTDSIHIDRRTVTHLAHGRSQGQCLLLSHSHHYHHTQRTLSPPDLQHSLKEQTPHGTACKLSLITCTGLCVA